MPNETQTAAILETNLDFPVRRGKVRDVYDLGNDALLLVSTDRISAFDWVLPTGIPQKGKVLTQISKFWFEQLDGPHHLITDDLTGETARAAGVPADIDLDVFAGRSIVVRKTEVVPDLVKARTVLTKSNPVLMISAKY